MPGVFKFLLSGLRHLYKVLEIPRSKRQREQRRREYLESLSEQQQLQQSSHGSDFVIVNGSVLPITHDGKGGILIINNVSGEVLHHDDGNGNITIFSDPCTGSSTVVPINYESNLYDERPITGTTISNVSSRRNSGVSAIDDFLYISRGNSGAVIIDERNGSSSRRNSHSSVIGNIAIDERNGTSSRRNSYSGCSSITIEERNGNSSRRNSHSGSSRKNSIDISTFIPEVLSIQSQSTTRSRRNSRVIEVDAFEVVSSDSDDDSDDDSESDYHD